MAAAMNSIVGKTKLNLQLYNCFFRNPNSPQEVNFRISKERNRFKGVFWEKYDKNQRKYLEFG